LIYFSVLKDRRRVTGILSQKFATKLKQSDMSQVLLQFEALLTQSGLLLPPHVALLQCGGITVQQKLYVQFGSRPDVFVFTATEKSWYKRT
jgi:hypothetical protein